MEALNSQALGHGRWRNVSRGRWEEEPEGGAATILIRELQASAMGFGDRPAEREAESGAATVARARAVGPSKSFEECRAGRRGNARAFVAHLDGPTSRCGRAAKPHRGSRQGVARGV